MTMSAMSPRRVAPGDAATPAKKRFTPPDMAPARGVSRTTDSNTFQRPRPTSTSPSDETVLEARHTGVHLVAVVFHHDLAYALSDPPSVEFLRGVTSELDARNLSLQLIPKVGRRLDLGAAFRTTADAIIVHAEVDPVQAEDVRATHKPIVLVDSHVDGTTAVRNQDRQGAELAMAHALAAHPHEVLALSFPINEPARARALKLLRPPPSGYIAGEHIAGYAAAARAAGFPLERIRWLEIDDREPESAAQAVAAARSHLAPRSRVAIVAMSDRMALAAQAVAKTWRGLRVVAIVGFDDIAAAAPAGLTTVRQNAYLKGQRAVQALLDGAKPEPLAVQLVVRNT